MKMMRSSCGIVGKRPVAGWLPGFLSFLLALGLVGCAGPSPVTPPLAPPEARKVPVKVFQSPVAPEHKFAKKAKPPKEREAESYIGDRGLERYTASLKKVPTSRPAPKKGEKVFPIDLNLKNADLVEAVRVLAETMGLNYSIDPKVKGTVNVRATGKLSESELLSIMESLLTVNGATMIKGPDGVYRIVPMDKAAARGLPVYSRGAVPPGMRAQVVFLEQTPAKEMLTVLKPLLSTAGSIGEASNNSLIVVDTPENMDKVLELIHLVDTRALAHTMVRILKVHNSGPKEIIGELETIFGAYGTLSGKDKAKFGVSFLPVGRLNGVMVLATSRDLMERALYWVRQLDAKTDMMANVHVYNVENYKAKNLANTLTQVYGGTAAAPTVKEVKPEVGTQPGGAAFGGAGGAAGGMGGMGGAQQQGGMGGAQQQGGMGGTASSGMGLTGAAAGVPGGQTGGSPLKERATGAGAGAEGTALKEGVRIIPDEENNLLVVVAPPYEWNIISRILKELDIMPRQVLNEVLIAEITLTDQLKYGVEFLIGGTAATSSNTATGTSTSPSGVLVASSSSTGNATAPATLSGVNVSGPGLGYLYCGQRFYLCGHRYLEQAQGLDQLAGFRRQGGNPGLPPDHGGQQSGGPHSDRLGRAHPYLPVRAPGQPANLFSDLYGAIPQHRHHPVGKAPNQRQGPGDPGHRPGSERRGQYHLHGVRQSQLYGAQRQDYFDYRGQSDHSSGRPHPGGQKPDQRRDSRLAAYAHLWAPVRFRRGKQNED